MRSKKKINQNLSLNLIISSLVWAIVILACSYQSENFDKDLLYILISGFFVEFLRITSLMKSLKQTDDAKVDSEEY